jgi:hypothetical protein
MHSRCSRPASCRNSAVFGGFGIAVISLVAIAFAPAFHARAHEGHVHEPAAPLEQAGLPRLVASSESYELVALLNGKQLTIYLDRFTDNSPVTDANISVAIEGETVVAERNPDGTYGVSSNLFSGRGFVELVFDIKAPEADDLLIGKLWLPSAPEKPSGTTAWYERASSALRHGAEDHFILLGLIAFCGVAIGFALRPGRRPRLPSILSLIVGVLCIAATEPSALAHESHDHCDDRQGTRCAWRHGAPTTEWSSLCAETHAAHPGNSDGATVAKPVALVRRASAVHPSAAAPAEVYQPNKRGSRCSNACQ